MDIVCTAFVRVANVALEDISAQAIISERRRWGGLSTGSAPVHGITVVQRPRHRHDVPALFFLPPGAGLVAVVVGVGPVGAAVVRVFMLEEEERMQRIVNHLIAYATQRQKGKRLDNLLGEGRDRARYAKLGTLGHPPTVEATQPRVTGQKNYQTHK